MQHNFSPLSSKKEIKEKTSLTPLPLPPLYPECMSTRTGEAWIAALRTFANRAQFSEIFVFYATIY